MTSQRAFHALILALGGLAIVAAIWMVTRGAGPLGREREQLGRGDYALMATDGTTFSQTSLQGHPSAVFFGFTHCPDVCPTTLGEIGVWKEALGDEGRGLRFWFVTVDPERDSVDQLRAYLSWTPGVTGAAGSRPEVDKAIAAFRIYARKVPLSDGGYTMDHTPFVMLFDRDGHFVQTIAYREAEGTAVEKLRALIGTS